MSCRDDGVGKPRVVVDSTRHAVGDDVCRMMFIGDSITHGWEGDFTWRYRLWQWLRSKNPKNKIDFVGPYTGLQKPDGPKNPQPPKVDGQESEPPEPARTDGIYHPDVDAAFIRNHFALWGRALAQGKDCIRDQIKAHQPDMLLVVLGFNDLGWLLREPNDALENMHGFIHNARSANRALSFFIADVPQRSKIDGQQDLADRTERYNKELSDAVRSWSTDESPVVLVPLSQYYGATDDHFPASYDGLHPNALGEYQIAKAFSQTLCTTFSTGTSSLEIPDLLPQPDTSVPKNICAQGFPMGVKVTWDTVLGAKGYGIRERIKDSPTWSESHAFTNRHDTTFTIEGIVWEYQIRTFCGDHDCEKGDWSDIIEATAQRDTLPPPETITGEAIKGGIRLSWSEVAGADLYEAAVWDQDTPGALFQSSGSRDTEKYFEGLLKGHRYKVWVSSWDGKGGGLPKHGNDVLVES